MMTNDPSSSSRPSAGATRPVEAPRPRPERRPADDGQRSRFENLLSRHERASRQDEEGDEDTGADAAAWGLAPGPAAWASSRQRGADSGGDGDASTDADRGAPSGAEWPATRPALTPEPDLHVPAPVFPVTEPQQARLYAHMALPLAPAGNAAARFEVLDAATASVVTQVELNTLPQGGLTVAIGTSVQHAALTDRHLPQLQRRLAGKVSAHLRVQESDAERD